MTTASNTTIRVSGCLDESIFSLLIGPPETDLMKLPTFQAKHQLAVIAGHAGTSPFSEMDSSKDRPTSSPNISGPHTNGILIVLT